jgi:phosphoribosylamine--glycine ligase
VIQARLDGREFSVIAVTDGEEVLGLPIARDHKRLCDGDTGPNTGGMGAYSPLPDLDEHALDAVVGLIHRPILAELARRGSPFVGFLYAGLIVGEDGVPTLLECNARLGDPEAQVILPRLAGNLGPVLSAAAAGRLSALPLSLPVLDAFAVGVVLAAAGYPGDPRRGDPITGLDEASASGALVFHGGTTQRPQGGDVTNGGRVLTVVGRGMDIASARAGAERAADMITWDGQQRRHDIGLRAPARSTLTSMLRVGAAS